MFYIYSNPQTNEQIEVEQGMNDVHEYVDEEGLKWDRVLTVPNMAMDAKIDPFSASQFMDKTNKKGTYGDLLDRSQELSYMRAEKNGGVDPLKQKTDEQWSKARNGRKLIKKLKDVEVEVKIKK